MKTFIHRLSLLLIGFNVYLVQAQTHNKVSARTKKVLDSTYSSLLKKYKAVGLSLAIVDSGKIVYSIGYRYSDQENKIKASDSTIYRIGSCSKSFTSLSIIQLQEKNKLNIEHSVKRYLPELTIVSRFKEENPIYIKDMMCHVSGLPCDVTNGFFCDAPPDMNWLIAELNKQTTISPRRYKHAYSNSAYGLLGEVIARLGNTSYSNYVKENIFVPLNMSSSYVEEDTSLAKRYAKGYVNKKRIKEPLIRDQAAGLIHSTVLDMSNYLLMYLNKGQHKSGYILSPDGIDEMIKNQIGDITLPDQDAWGYGLYSKRAQIKKGQDSSVIHIVQHAGDTYAYHADFGFIPELQVGVVVLTNSDKGASIRSANKLLKIYLKEAKGIKLNTNFKTPLDSLVLAAKRPCSPEEIKGTYNMNQLLIKVKSAKKIKFKQGPVRVVLNQKKDDPSKYKLKAVVLGIIPIKIKDQLFTFENKADKTYAKVILTSNGGEEYLAFKADPKPIPAEWKKAYGKYQITGKSYVCTNCPYGNSEGLKLILKEEEGYVVMVTKAKSPDMNGKSYLEVINDRLLVTGGIGRNTGESVKILENGNLYYSGFEFVKTN